MQCCYPHVFERCEDKGYLTNFLSLYSCQDRKPAKNCFFKYSVSFFFLRSFGSPIIANLTSLTSLTQKTRLFLVRNQQNSTLFFFGGAACFNALSLTKNVIFMFCTFTFFKLCLAKSLI